MVSPTLPISSSDSAVLSLVSLIHLMGLSTDHEIETLSTFLSGVCIGMRMGSGWAENGDGQQWLARRLGFGGYHT